MASKILLVVIGVAVVSVLASAAAPAQPPRIQADVVVMGYVPCNNGTSMKSGSAPGFPNAVVQLQCAGNAVAAVAGNATTDGKGWFRMAMNTTAVLSSVASGCSLVVATPLATCEAALPAAPVRPPASCVSMLFFPRGFSYVAPV